MNACTTLYLERKLLLRKKLEKVPYKIKNTCFSPSCEILVCTEIFFLQARGMQMKDCQLGVEKGKKETEKF